MRYVKPDFYDDFHCIADQCPASCCEGWQIVIDEDSLERYGTEEGEFGRRLRNSIDWQEGIFCQYEKRCAFLNGQNLCDLQKELGEHALCETCGRYPRHIEEYEGLREYSLSLSCPHAARMMLEKTDNVTFLSWEDEEEDDFDEFDFLMFTQLEDAREVIFRIVQNRRIDLRIRMDKIVELAKKMQECVDENRLFDVDQVIETYRNWEENYIPGTECVEKDFEKIYEQRIKEFSLFFKLERLRDDWGEILDQTWKILLEHGRKTYVKVLTDFHNIYGYESKNSSQWEIFGEQLLMFFLYTYFCGAVYDDMIYSKMALSVFSVTWIMEFFVAEWMNSQQQADRDTLIMLAYRYAREIEHSDLNLNQMEEWFACN